MLPFTRLAILALIISAAFAVLGDATEFFGARSPVAVTGSGLAAFVGLGLAFLGLREWGGTERRRLTRYAALAWAASIVLVGLGSVEFTGATVVRALGGAAFAAAPVLAVWTLGHRLARLTLAAGVVAVSLAYLGGAALEAADARVAGLTLPGNLLLFMGYWMTLRTYEGP